MQNLRTDVAIIGGGPAGSTTGGLLRKYNPDLQVAIFEREHFPRDHVGESQLPAVCTILAELGAWDKVEAADFPVKLGAAYRWGATNELWYLNFVDPAQFVCNDRPEQYRGHRRETAFQVDRSIYDKVLLDHANSLGCKVYEGAAVREVVREDERVARLRVESEDLGGEVEVQAQFYVDGSGENGVLRRAMGVETDIPTTLRNIAFWAYWQDAEWAESIGKGATRIQVMSLGWGWIWFIPITPTRTSIGLVLPAEYYKKTGRRPEALYHEAIQSEPLISSLVRNARCEDRLLATKDWNFLANRLAGENWFMVGDSCGFADPILSAGMTLAHTSGQKAAYSILELLRNRLDPKWVRDQYSQSHRQQIRQHMRFAEFWYAGNGRFTDLKAYCSEIAASSGLKLEADDAFYWLSVGGFALDQPGSATAATFPLVGVKYMASSVTGTASSWSLNAFNRLRLNLQGAEEGPFALYERGGIQPIVSFTRGGRKLPMVGYFGLGVRALQQTTEISQAIQICLGMAAKENLPIAKEAATDSIIQTLEALLVDGWVVGELDPGLPRLDLPAPTGSRRK